MLPAGLLARFEDPKWKERLDACEKLKQVCVCVCVRERESVCGSVCVCESK